MGSLKTCKHIPQRISSSNFSKISYSIQYILPWLCLSSTKGASSFIWYLSYPSLTRVSGILSLTSIFITSKTACTCLISSSMTGRSSAWYWRRFSPTLIYAFYEFTDYFDLDFEDETRLDDGKGDDISGSLWLKDEEREADRRARALIFPLEAVISRGGRSFKESCLSCIWKFNWLIF